MGRLYHNNNLFAREKSTGREIQFTADTSTAVYDGYSSWLYEEEIIGRESDYKAFWWIPDSKRIPFLRFDETRVRLFPIYNGEGKPVIQQHYPEVGDANPGVRLGIACLADSSVIWANLTATGILINK